MEIKKCFSKQREASYGNCLYEELKSVLLNFRIDNLNLYNLSF